MPLESYWDKTDKRYLGILSDESNKKTNLMLNFN